MKKLVNAIVAFDRDDSGDALQTVMVLSIAAMVCLGVIKVAGISTSGQNSTSSGIFGAVGDLILDLLPNATGM